MSACKYCGNTAEYERGYRAGIEEAAKVDPDEAEAKAMCRIWGNNCPQFALACIQRGRELGQGEARKAIELLRRAENYIAPRDNVYAEIRSFLARHDKESAS